MSNGGADRTGVPIDWLLVIPAISSTFAAFLSVVATWRSPIVAARLAEWLRREGERDDQRLRRKLEIFSSLMQERADLYTASGVRVLNQIDVVFAESRDVREAWARLFSASQRKSSYPPHVTDERLTELLSAIARDIGLSGQLQSDDMTRVYYPDAMRQAQMVRELELKAALDRFGKGAAPEGSAEARSVWPEAPSSP